MDFRLEEYLKLNSLFNKNGYNLYLVGGTVRDYLLGLPLSDMDAVTDATPNEMKKFLIGANYTFEKFGSVTYKTDKKVKFDITTMREETLYEDARHPSKITFVKDLKIDVKRRDFTVNGLYLDKDLKVIDFVDGQKDIKNRTLRMIGDPEKRLDEDPLRIIRAIRFAADYSLTIDDDLDEAIKNSVYKLAYLNQEKIKQDLKKAKAESQSIVLQYLEKYHIKLDENVIE